VYRLDDLGVRYEGCIMSICEGRGNRNNNKVIFIDATDISNVFIDFY